VLVMVKYLFRESRSGIYRYRRRIPSELQGAYGRNMIDRSLGTTDPELARRKRDEVHKEVEAQLKRLSSMDREQHDYERALRILKDKGIVRRGAEEVPELDPEDDKTALAYADAILAEGAKQPPEARKVPLKDAPEPLKTLIKGVYPL